MAKVNIPTFKLNNGAGIPAVGYGTWLGMTDKFELYSEDCPKMMDALSYAIDVGYRHIDTAHFYRVEPEVGLVLNKKIRERVVRREDLFVTTKVWQHFHREADVEVSLRGSLERMGLEYVDMSLIHWPMSIDEEGKDEKIDYLETWRGLESALAKGLTKGIGVSNFTVEQLTRLLQHCRVPPAVNQIEINLNLGQEELVSFCQSKNIVIVAYSPFGTMVPSRALPNSPEPKMNNPNMVAMAEKYGKTVSQITLRYLFQRGIVSIPKTITKTRVIENASIFDFMIEKTDFEKLSKFDCGYRTVRPIFWQNYTNYPFDKVTQSMDIPLSMRKWKDGCL